MIFKLKIGASITPAHLFCYSTSTFWS